MTLAAGQIIGLLATAGLLAVVGEPIAPSAALAWAAAAGASGVTGLGCFYLALSRGSMGLVAPLTALIGAAVPAVAGLLGGEPASPALMVGIGTALGAVVLISLPDRSTAASRTSSRSPAQGRWDLLLAVLAGLGFAGFFLGMDQSRLAGGGVWWPILAVRIAGVAVALAATMIVAARGNLARVEMRRRVWALFPLAGLGDLGGNLFFIMANTSGDLAVAVVLSSLYPVVTALLARIVLSERLSPLRLAGVALATIAIALIAVSTA